MFGAVFRLAVSKCYRRCLKAVAMSLTERKDRLATGVVVRALRPTTIIITLITTKEGQLWWVCNSRGSQARAPDTTLHQDCVSVIPERGTAHLMARLSRPLSCCRAQLLAASSCMFAFKLDEAACCCVSRLHASSSMLATEGRRRNVPSEIAYRPLAFIMSSS